MNGPPVASRGPEILALPHPEPCLGLALACLVSVDRGPIRRRLSLDPLAPGLNPEGVDVTRLSVHFSSGPVRDTGSRDPGRTMPHSAASSVIKFPVTFPSRSLELMGC